MIAVDRSEVLRYLGYRGGQIEDAVEQSIDRCTADLLAAVQPRGTYRRFALAHPSPDMLEIDGLQVHSVNLSRNLKGCGSVYLMAATLGVEADRRITRACAVRMSDAVIYQAVAATLIEAYCDELNDAIRAQAAEKGLYCHPRFSPGYGDFDIKHQRDFIRLLDTPRKIGLTVTDSCLLAPIKSVTAVIGVSDVAQPCHRKGCEECEKTDCAFRR